MAQSDLNVQIIKESDQEGNGNEKHQDVQAHLTSNLSSEESESSESTEQMNLIIFLALSIILPCYGAGIEYR